ncbi:hypothetical protein BDC45DRAFT_587220 [Circinella umbellata]|nr:hypothetical protein BDC45DRAFT_587220 [Circinella umbellata]
MERMLRRQAIIFAIILLMHPKSYIIICIFVAITLPIIENNNRRQWKKKLYPYRMFYHWLWANCILCFLKEKSAKMGKHASEILLPATLQLVVASYCCTFRGYLSKYI